VRRKIIRNRKPAFNFPRQSPAATASLHATSNQSGRFAVKSLVAVSYLLWLFLTELSSGFREAIMHGQLQCDRCGSRFFPEDAEQGKLWEQIRDEGPWLDLGDGATFEDRLHARLETQGGIPCPCCGAPVELTEASLGELSLHLLEQW
jgi:hypothetical protein